MITRYALFKGQVTAGKETEFRQAVLNDLLPTWQVYPGATAVRVAFSFHKDELANPCPLILAFDFPTEADLARALASDERLASRAETQRILPGLFEGDIHHYVTENLSFPTT